MSDLLSKMLYCLPPEMAHYISMKALSVLPMSHNTPQVSCPSLWGLAFPNPVGLAAGLDKNGDYIEGLAKLGFGFIEIGTITPRAQLGNPKPRLFRSATDNAVINRMGFNNKGVDYLVDRLQKTTYRGILGVNIGKNLTTTLDNANQDYLHCLKAVYRYASYITVNISSPNTPGLRDLQFGERLVSLFKEILQAQKLLADKYKKYVPILAKLAPDMSLSDLQHTVSSLDQLGIHGLIISNTSNQRLGIKSSAFSEQAGGLSGAPIFDLTTECLKRVRQCTDLPLIGVGGISNYQQARMKMEAGANLIQLYTGMVFKGPTLPRMICSQWQKVTD